MPGRTAPARLPKACRASAARQGTARFSICLHWWYKSCLVVPCRAGPIFHANKRGISSHLAVSGSCPQSLPNMVMVVPNWDNTWFSRSFAPLRGSCAPGGTDTYVFCRTWRSTFVTDRLPYTHGHHYKGCSWACTWSWVFFCSWGVGVEKIEYYTFSS